MNADVKAGAAVKQKILVVDDEPGFLIMAQEALLKEGFEVCTVTSGDAALRKLPEFKPDLVLLDLMMPGLDGVETCRAIRQLPGFANTPVIVVTGRDDVAAVDRSYEAGAWDFTSKPINWALLRHRIRYSLRAFNAFHSEQKAARLSKTLDKSSNEIIVFDAQTMGVISANASALVNLGYKNTELLSLRFPDVLDGLSAEELELRLAELDDNQQISITLKMLRHDGTNYPVDGTVLYNTEEQPHVYISIFQDVTERREAEKQLHQLAYYDDLTGLPNRRMFKEHVKMALSTAKRNSTLCAVCVLDLDSFKSVNDAFGHSQGDLLLKQVTDRLSTQIRQNDAVARLRDESLDNEVDLEFARLGGDDFLILLTNFDDAVAPARVADRILKSIATPFMFHGQEISITASMGIAMFPGDGDSLEQLMQCADDAMYSAKEAGKNNYTYYSRKTGMNSLTRLTLETELRRAIERDELELYYQPKVDGLSGKIVGAEALVRWHHPEKGMQPPATFIPVAEESGLIIPMGDWAMQSAMEQLTRWAGRYGPTFKCAVNISGLQLRQDGFLRATSAMLKKRNPRDGKLIIELTESSIMTSTQARIDWMQEVRSLGAEIAIDDFGTGYSSLSYLKKLPIDSLKIDRSFIIDIATNADDRVITSAIFLMAQALGLKVVVEGVETAEQLGVVNQMGNAVIQGYLYSPPLPVAELEDWIDSRENTGSSALKAML